MNRTTSTPIAAVMAGAGLALVSSAAIAAGTIPFDEAHLFFELNDTDGDLGIHSLIDGDDWKSLRIEDARHRKILGVLTSGSLRQQGLTELFFESAEPSFEDLVPEAFFARFPPGVYHIEGVSLEGQKMRSSVVLSHLLPGPPGNVQVNGIPAAENCDAPDLPIVSPPVVITWDAVTQSHPELGEQGPAVVDRYQVFAEQIGDPGLKFSLDLPPEMTQYTVAPELIALGEPQYKFEIQVREFNHNQTAIESCFIVQ